MIAAYTKSKDMKHPRDKGRAREIILENFLTETGLVPRKYGVSSTSARVVSTTGHSSKELDIVIYDYLENVHLMKRNSALEYYPRETVLGVIQVKSKLGRLEIANAFENIASYKALYDGITPYARIFTGRIPTTKGFGIIFAYGSDLEWTKLVDELKKQASLHDKSRLPNAIYILEKGLLMFGNGSMAFGLNQDIELLADPQVHGYPDRDGSSLFQLYSLLMEILKKTTASRLHIESYYNLPHTAGALSYQFALSPFTEVGNCATHGNFLRKISALKLAQIIAYCRSQEPVSAYDTVSALYNLPPDEEARKRQNGEVYIYNPDNLPLVDILTSDKAIGITYDMINTEGMQIWIPWFYTVKDGLIDGCPSCAKTTRAESRRSAKKS